MPGPEGSEGPKVSVDAKYMYACFLFIINLVLIETMSSLPVYVNYFEATL